MIIVRKIQIPGLETAKPRRLYIYLPKDYEVSDRRYPVLYMFDGHNVFYNSHATYGKSWGMKEYLQKTKLPLIVVGIESNREGRRLSEYSPWDFSRREVGFVPGRGQVTMDWIVKTLKSSVDAEFRTLPDREHTMIAGSSMGGLITVYAAVAYNDVFSRAAALSPCFFLLPREVAALIKEKAPLAQPTRIYMDYGSAEWNGKCKGHWAEMFRTAARLSRAGAYTAARVVPGAVHNEAAWEKRIPVFMDYLYPKD